ncbi:MAG TPA: 1,4-alpha-glucan branching protein domain-containing protein [Gemmatimonadales bacterium]
MSLRFVLTLHSHLPWVLNHGRWPHGSDWICEAALDSYLPLIAMLEQLEAEHVPAALTLGITPILAAQFADPAFRDELDHYFAHRLETIDEAPASLRSTGDDDLLPLVSYWRDHTLGLRAIWERVDKDLIGEFRRHANDGRIELISSAATHGFLPLLGRDESIRLQLLVGRAEHARHFGDLPRGCWAPECAYRPRGPWRPIPGAPSATIRGGTEEHLRYAGFGWFYIDAHLADAGESIDQYGGAPRARRTEPATRSPYRGYQVGVAPRGGRPVYALVRDPRSTEQVWSRHGGYPGDGRYLEFHKIRFPGGLKYWSVTDANADLGSKAPYQPDRAREAAAIHAAHFQEILDQLSAGAERGDDAIIAPFDTELFGHWWFEGINFLRYLFEDLTANRDTANGSSPSTSGAALRAAPPTTAVRLAEGSWGKDGDFSMWMNPETEWTWRRLWPLEDRFWNAVPSALQRWDARPILEQAARELLLAQSSDWQFIISTGAAGDYATKRFVEHCDALERLLPFVEHGDSDLGAGRQLAAELFAIDGPFAELGGAIAAASDVRTRA